MKNVKKIKKILRITLSALLIICIAIPVMADSLEEKKAELDDAKSVKEQLETELEESRAKLAELQNNKESLILYIDDITEDIEEIQTIIDGYQAQADEKQAKIDVLNSEIEEKEEEIDEKYDRMKMRIQYMYENLDDNYMIDTLFSSSSLAEIFEKSEYVASLYDYDKKAMQAIVKLKEAVEEKKAVVVAELEDVESLVAATEEQQNVMAQLKAVQEEELAKVEAMMEEEQAMIKAINSEIDKQKDEINRLTREYNSAAASGGGYVYTGGDFLWPLPSPYLADHISSGYGYREGTYSGFHDGIDIWANSGTPIYAVLDGVVVASYYSDSAGNFTIIYHGGNLYTEYMHQSERYVSVGDKVTVGQTIGLVGSTGWSTGAHLHIGVVISSGGYNYNNRVDPSPYLGLS